jgi:hypothetical protein
VKTSIKLGGKHVRLTAHPRSLDRTSVPDESLLKEFGFLDVNTAIVNVVVTLTNTPGSQDKAAVTRGELEDFVKDALAESSNRSFT